MKHMAVQEEKKVSLSALQSLRLLRPAIDLSSRSVDTLYFTYYMYSLLLCPANVENSN